jgi:hypothetical protein
MQPEILRGNGVLGRCKDVVFREMGECIHLYVCPALSNQMQLIELIRSWTLKYTQLAKLLTLDFAEARFPQR